MTDSDRFEGVYPAMVTPFNEDGSIDFEQLRRDARRLETAGVDAGGIDLWEMLDLADESGLRDDVEAVIGDYERTGAERSERLPHAEFVGRFDAEGVCSLNAEHACRIALEVHGLDSEIDVLIGRDTVEESKPHPQPLRAALSALDVPPDQALFVGDSASDAETARRAGVAFQSVAERLA